jgi:hypothetical protein
VSVAEAERIARDPRHRRGWRRLIPRRPRLRYPFAWPDRPDRRMVGITVVLSILWIWAMVIFCLGIALGIGLGLRIFDLVR